MPSNEIGEDRKGLCQVNRAGGAKHPIEAVPGSFSMVLQHETEFCYVTKSLCGVSARIAAVFLLGIDSNASIKVDSYPLR